MAIKEVVYKGRDNVIDLQLASDSGVADLSGVTDVELVDPYNSISTISITNNPGCFDLTTGNGIIKLSLGLISSLVSKTSYELQMIVYDANNEHGVNWGSFIISVL